MLKKKQLTIEWKLKRIKTQKSSAIKSSKRKISSIFFSYPYPEYNCPMQTNPAVYKNFPKDENSNIDYNVQWSHSSCCLLVKQVMLHYARYHSSIIP